MVNLDNHGLTWTIDKDTIIPDDYRRRISSGDIIDSKIEVNRKDGTIHNYSATGKFINKGAYGRVFETINLNTGELCIVKVIKMRSDLDLKHVIIEAIIQIIVYEETKESAYPELELFGPFTAKIFDICYNSKKRECYIFSERLSYTFDKYIKHIAGLNGPKYEKCVDVSKMLIKIATILSELHKKIKLNHLDLKTDNCMMVTKHYIMPRLIDFGLSSIEYNGTIINANIKYINSDIEGRDMGQMIYYIMRYSGNIFQKEFCDVMERLLRFEKNGKNYSLLKDNICKNWKNTYLHFRQEQNCPNSKPEIVKRTLEAYLNYEAWHLELAYTEPVINF